MSPTLHALQYPELFFGIAGPIGIDVDELTKTLSESLTRVGYHSIQIRVTEEINKIKSEEKRPRAKDFHSLITFKMAHASALCRRHQDPATLMRITIDAIRRNRASEVARKNIKYEYSSKYNLKSPSPSPEETVVPKTAYVIRQLKRPEEVYLLRRIYGKQFILISAYGSAEHRKHIIENKLRRSLSISSSPEEVNAKAENLINRDASEDADSYGQHLRDTFHLADVFVDGISKTEMTIKINRFIDALFGKTDIAPTKMEYGMYAAKSASLRSSDLSRQVGAAIFTEDGEIITQGCNEVPKAFGGTYWDTEDPDFRDVKLGSDPNEVLKREVIRDLLERLSAGGLLSIKAQRMGTTSEMVDILIKKAKNDDSEKGFGVLSNSSIMELTEYGRVVHAEMCAICDAARLGKSVKGSILFCTTFPCHNCTKHILAAGIKKVIYMEPYPKSKAKELHENEISIESEIPSKVSFIPFLGISPFRYRDIFQKGKRKKDGIALDWCDGEPRPMIDTSAPTYTDLEAFEYSKIAGKMKKLPLNHKSEISQRSQRRHPS